MINDNDQPLEEHKDIYDQQIINGKNISSNSTIGVVALVRNAESILERNLSFLYENLLQYFKDYEFFIYENDSEDETVSVLENWSSTDKRNNFISEKLNAPKFGTATTQDRLKIMSKGRNICQENISKKHDYILVIDLDFVSVDKKGLFNSIGWLSQDYISAISGFSYHYRTQPLPEGLKTQNPMWTNYDSWAYRHTHWQDLYSKGMMYWFWWWIPHIGLLPWTVNSAFGGSCIFKSKFYFSGKYDDYDCEHVTHFFNIKSKNPDFNLFVNPSQRMVV